VRVVGRIPLANATWDRSNPDPGSSYAPYKIYNIGNNSPIELSKFIELLEQYIGEKSKKNMLPMQPGDVPITFADVIESICDVGFRPSTPIDEGLKKFVKWYDEYYGIA
jgi:UDP-glucuronate 4-epimerase